jgi:hypothetical protein
MAGSEQLELFVANARQYWVAAIFHNNANCVFRFNTPSGVSLQKGTPVTPVKEPAFPLWQLLAG